MSKDTRPDDLITTAEAAKIAERSERTIRRWTQPEVSKLDRWLGEPAVTGGAAPVLVSKRELMTLLAVSGQEPRSGGRPNPQAVSRDTADTSTDTGSSDKGTAPADTTVDIRVAVLEERLQAAELRTQLAAVTADRDGLARQVEDLRTQLEDLRRRSDNAHAELRSDLADERDRSRALEAELTALRQVQGVPWWRKLLGGPVAQLPAPEAK